MAGAFSDYMENNIVRWMFRNTQMPTPPTTVYVALYTTAPTDAGGGTEASGNAYARVGVTTGTSGTGVGSGWTDTNGTNGISQNVAAVTFPTATGSWGTIVAVGIFDAASNGNLLAWATVTSLAISSGDRPVYDPNQITVTVD